MIGTSISKSGKVIRLTKERWQHISKGHSELRGKERKVLEAIKDPDFIAKGGKEELIAVKTLDGEYLVVVYREEREGGFVLTAWAMSKVERIRKRGIIWQK